MVRRPPTLSLSIAALCCAIWALWAWLARDRQASVAPSPPPSSFDEAHVDAHTSLALFRPAVAADCATGMLVSTPRAALRLKWVPTAPSSGMSPGASTVAAAATAHATAQSRHALPGLTAEHAVTPLIVLHELHVGEGLLTGMLRSTGAAVVVAQDAGGVRDAARRWYRAIADAGSAPIAGSAPTASATATSSSAAAGSATSHGTASRGGMAVALVLSPQALRILNHGVTAPDARDLPPIRSARNVLRSGAATDGGT